MKQIVQKKLSVVTFVLFIFALFVGICVTKAVNADDKIVPFEKWEFFQRGQWNPYELGNEGYINTVTMNNTNETLTGWLRGEGSDNQTQKASTEATGFVIDIDNTGWDAQWDKNPVRIHPWSIHVSTEAHINSKCWYEVSFKARASRKKYAYVTFYDDEERINSWGDKELLVLDREEKTFKYTIDSYLSSNKLKIVLWFGAFDAQYDFDGDDISNIVTEIENQWKGSVYISDFKIEEYPHLCPPLESFVVTFKDGDTILSTQTIFSGGAAQAPVLKKEGYRLSWDQWFYHITSDLVVNAVWFPDEFETSTNKTETEEMTETDETKETDYTRVSKIEVGKTKVLKATKVKSSKKIKICLKKIRRASRYQIQISANRKFKKKLINKKIKKISFIVSSKKLKGQKKLYVRARALKVINGRNCFGKWSQVKKMKIK